MEEGAQLTLPITPWTGYIEEASQGRWVCIFHRLAIQGQRPDMKKWGTISLAYLTGLVLSCEVSRGKESIAS